MRPSKYHPERSSEDSSPGDQVKMNGGERREIYGSREKLCNLRCVSRYVKIVLYGRVVVFTEVYGTET